MLQLKMMLRDIKSLSQGYAANICQCYNDVRSVINFSFTSSIHKYLMSTDYEPNGIRGTRRKTITAFMVLRIFGTVIGEKLPLIILR